MKPRIYHATQALTIAALAALILFVTSTMLTGCQSLARQSSLPDCRAIATSFITPCESSQDAPGSTNRGLGVPMYQLSDEEAGYNQAEFDRCRDSNDENCSGVN